MTIQKMKINILHRYCSAIDLSISAEEYIDKDNHALDGQIILMIKLLNLLNSLLNRKLKFKVKKI